MLDGMLGTDTLGHYILFTQASGDWDCPLDFV